MEYTLRDTAFIAILAWFMYAVYLYGIVASQVNNSRSSSVRGPKKRSRPNFCSFFCVAWLFYVIVFNYLANLHFQPLFVGIQARFYLQPNILVVISSALMLFQIFRCLALSTYWMRFTVSVMFLLFAWQVNRTFPTVDNRYMPVLHVCADAVKLNLLFIAKTMRFTDLERLFLILSPPTLY